MADRTGKAPTGTGRFAGLNDGALVVVAAMLLGWVWLASYMHANMFSARLGSSAWALALQGAGLAALVACAAACLAELWSRRGDAPFAPSFGRALMVAGGAGLALLGAGLAWGVDRLCTVGSPDPGPYLMGRVPPFGTMAALLPVGACLALGRRGRVAVYAASAALAAAGAAVYLTHLDAFEPLDGMLVRAEPVVLGAADALRVCAVGLVPRLSAFAMGLGVAWLLEEAALRVRAGLGPGDPASDIAAAEAAPAAARGRLGWGRVAMCAVCGWAAAYVVADVAEAALTLLPRGGNGLFAFALQLALECLPLALGLLAVAGRVWPGVCLALAAVVLGIVTLAFGSQDVLWAGALAAAVYLAASAGMLPGAGERPGRKALSPLALAFGAAFLLTAAWLIVFHSPFRQALELVDPALRPPIAGVLCALGAVCAVLFALLARRRDSDSPAGRAGADAAAAERAAGHAGGVHVADAGLAALDGASELRDAGELDEEAGS